MLPPSIHKYLATRAAAGPWRIEGTDRRDFTGAIVVPALAESASLFATLESLAKNPQEALDRFLIVVVVNHREDAPTADKADNLALLRRLQKETPCDLRFARVDAASPGLELPNGEGGVGLARKIGFDLSLGHLDFTGPAPLLIALDADTLVRPDYLPALLRHFETARKGGAILPFRHQPGATPAEETAIRRYELFLRHYVLGLSLARSPYAFHTIGSAMACRAEAYVRAGGMNRRRAGEDFYFLQQLAKTSGVAPLRGTAVYPSSRPSHRTPFGTGRSVSRMLGGEEETVRFYRPECFQLLGTWLNLATESWQAPGTEVRGRALALSAHLTEYLDGLGFTSIWSRLQRNHRQRDAFLAGFHGWFDGFKTLKLIHHLCAGPLPKVDPEQTLPELLRWASLDPAGDMATHLARLRAHQTEDIFANSLLY